MKNILIIMGRYLPGHKDGGPLRTIVNVTEALGDEYNFYIACYDRDHGDKEPYSNIMKGQWNVVGKAKVFYVIPGGFTENLILKLTKHMDCIYLTSFYEEYGYRTLLLKRKGEINVPVTVASMGVFSKEALTKNALKKKIFIDSCKLIGLFKNISWSVTSEIEAEDVKKSIGNNIRYIVAEDLPRKTIPGIKNERMDHRRIIFLSRICEHKNPLLLIEAVNLIDKIDIEVDFYGPIQEEKYWEKCLDRLNNVHFKWTYGGDVSAECVQSILADHAIFVLPSQSENYGHVIFEALSVGCIPVISDRTPWQDIEREKVGLICNLEVEDFAMKIRKLIELDNGSFELMRRNAVKYATAKVQQSLKDTGYRKIFD